MRRTEMELWTEPGSYVGFNPTEDYLLLSVHRESGTIDESNWQVANEMLEKLCATLPPFDGERDEGYGTREGWFYVWRARHCLVGWVEYLMIRGDAPQALIDLGNDIVDKLDSYPILNDEHWSDLEYNQIYEWWGRESLKFRIELCAEAGDSIFAARRKHDIPEATFDRIRDTWR